MLVLNKRVFSDVAMSATRTSEVIDIGNTSGHAVHAIWTGTPVGNLTVEASNDGVNFFVLATQAAGGAASQYLLNSNGAHYQFIRVVYTFSSSTGVLNCYISSKSI